VARVSVLPLRTVAGSRLVVKSCTFRSDSRYRKITFW
jgi:hypothetical protein